MPPWLRGRRSPPAASPKSTTAVPRENRPSLLRYADGRSRWQSPIHVRPRIHGDHRLHPGWLQDRAQSRHRARHRGALALRLRHHRRRPADAGRRQHYAAAGLQTLVGGNITLLSSLCEKTRAHAFELMLNHAAEMGANAVVGARYDATEIMSGVTEVLAYGTAVFVEPQ